MRRSRLSRDGWPVAWPLCRYRHNGHNAELGIMPRRMRCALGCWSFPARLVGIIIANRTGFVSGSASSTTRSKQMDTPQKTAIRRSSGLGPLGDHAARFGQSLSDRNYAKDTIARYLRCLALLAQAMEREGVALEDLDEAQAVALVGENIRRGRRKRRIVRGITGGDRAPCCKSHLPDSPACRHHA